MTSAVLFTIEAFGATANTAKVKKPLA